MSERALFCGRCASAVRPSSALLNGLHKNTLAEMSRHQSKERQNEREGGPGREEEEQKRSDGRTLSECVFGQGRISVRFQRLRVEMVSVSTDKFYRTK